MKKMDNKLKKQVYGGAGFMIAWVTMMGAGLLLSSLTSIISNLTNTSYSSKSSYSAASKKPPVIRMTAIPSRSSINFYE